MIKCVSAPFRSKRIHIGMDEAHYLGLGTYLSKFGYRNRFDIMNDHLKRVMDITEKYGLKPMIWSDMYFRLASKTGDYYDEESTIPQEVIDKYPKNVQLVYWDYYHQYEEDYSLFINKHKAFGAPPVFAGGIWTWSGIGTNYRVSFLCTNHALNACKKGGVKEVFATMWGDDGAENNYFSSLLGLQLFAEHGYSKQLEMEKLKARVKFCTGVDFDAFMDLNYLDETPGSLPDNSDFSNPSKFLLWQDILIGLFDKHVEGLDLASHFSKLESKFKEYSEKYVDYGFVFNVPHKLCTVLKIKCDVGIRIKKAYDDKDRSTMNEIANKQLPDLKIKVEQLKNAHREQWMKTNKPFGWEVIDIRYGGVMNRIDTAIFRINSYLNGEIQGIEELEEEKLYFDDRKNNEGKGLGRCSQYSKIASAGNFTHCMF
jgi:hypothetical protein